MVGPRGSNVTRRGPIMGQVHRVLDGFVLDKDESLLELASPS